MRIDLGANKVTLYVRKKSENIKVLIDLLLVKSNIKIVSNLGTIVSRGRNFHAVVAYV